MDLVAAGLIVGAAAIFGMYENERERFNQTVPTSRQGVGPEGAYNLIRVLPVEILRNVQEQVDRLNTGCIICDKTAVWHTFGRRRERYKPY